MIYKIFNVDKLTDILSAYYSLSKTHTKKSLRWLLLHIQQKTQKHLTNCAKNAIIKDNGCNMCQMR